MSAVGVGTVVGRGLAVLAIAAGEACAVIAMYRTGWPDAVRFALPWVTATLAMSAVLPWKTLGRVPVVFMAGLIASASWVVGLTVCANRWGT